MSKQELKLDLQLCHKFYAASNAITRLYRPILNQLNLTYPQYLVMITLWEYDREHKESFLLAKDLSSLTKIDPGALTLILKKLTEKGYVKLESDPMDKRSKNIKLKPAGKKLYQQAQTIPTQMSAFFEHMQEKDFEKLNKLMKKLLSKLD